MKFNPSVVKVKLNSREPIQPRVLPQDAQLLRARYHCGEWRLVFLVSGAADVPMQSRLFVPWKEGYELPEGASAIPVATEFGTHGDPRVLFEMIDTPEEARVEFNKMREARSGLSLAPVVPAGAVEDDEGDADGDDDDDEEGD